MAEQHLTLQERLTRFHAKTIADEKTPFCSGKQELDWYLLQGKGVPPSKDKPLFYDPLNYQLKQVKDLREKLVKKNEKKYKAKDFQNSLTSIPKVN